MPKVDQRAGAVMRAAWVWVVAFGALTGCAGSQPEAQPSTPAASRGQAFLEPGLRFSKDAEKVYLQELAELDGRLAENDDAFSYGMTICLDIRQGKTDAQITEDAAARFEFDDATAKAIVEAAKSSLCKQ